MAEHGEAGDRQGMQGAGQLGALGADPAPGIGHLPGDGDGTGMGWRWGWDGMWTCRWAWLSRAHGQAGQGCWELETSPAAALLGQGLPWSLYLSFVNVFMENLLMG